jgi:hypothetical protein
MSQELRDSSGKITKRPSLKRSKSTDGLGSSVIVSNKSDKAKKTPISGAGDLVDSLASSASEVGKMESPSAAKKSARGLDDPSQRGMISMHS